MSEPLPELASSCSAALMLLDSWMCAVWCTAACLASDRGCAVSLAGDGPHWGRGICGTPAPCCSLQWKSWVVVVPSAIPCTRRGWHLHLCKLQQASQHCDRFLHGIGCRSTCEVESAPSTGPYSLRGQHSRHLHSVTESAKSGTASRRNVMCATAGLHLQRRRLSRQTQAALAWRGRAPLCCASGPWGQSTGCAVCRTPCRAQAREYGLLSCLLCRKP